VAMTVFGGRPLGATNRVNVFWIFDFSRMEGFGTTNRGRTFSDGIGLLALGWLEREVLTLSGGANASGRRIPG
jgi:hypothetical protein